MLNEERDSRDFYFFSSLLSAPCKYYHCKRYWIDVSPKQLCLDSVNVVNCTAFNLCGFKNICLNFSVATKTTRVNIIKGNKLINSKNPISYNRPRGPTDKASDYESGDSRFESWWGRKVLYFCPVL